jgi:hypothetical protein
VCVVLARILDSYGGRFFEIGDLDALGILGRVDYT